MLNRSIIISHTVLLLPFVFCFILSPVSFIFLSQAVLLSPGQGRVREGEDAAGISNQQSHCNWTLSCQQGTGSGNGCPARSGLLYVYHVN